MAPLKLENSTYPVKHFIPRTVASDDLFGLEKIDYIPCLVACRHKSTTGLVFNSQELFTVRIKTHTVRS